MINQTFSKALAVEEVDMSAIPNLHVHFSYHEVIVLLRMCQLVKFTRRLVDEVEPKPFQSALHR